MSVSSIIQNITEAYVNKCGGNEYGAAFDSVVIKSTISSVSLCLPAGTGQSVADAINAAIAPAMVEAAE